MKTNLLKIALRQKAIAIPDDWRIKDDATMNATTGELVINCAKLGFSFSEDLLRAVNQILPTNKLVIFDYLKEVSGTKKNWTPLVKQWDIPTNESIKDHLVTWFSNIFNLDNGTKLACGHVIPEHTFPLERYNGCPFCGTPFEVHDLDYTPDKNPLKVLKLWSDTDLQKYLKTLLESPVALDATQIDSLKILLNHFEIPKNTNVGIKETLMLLIDALVEVDKADIAGDLFNNANDILRYLWYKHTGFLQIVEPRTIIKKSFQNGIQFRPSLDTRNDDSNEAIAKLKLKYSRTECRRYAAWINGLKLKTEKQCEIMHPKREIWVRVIRALRLSEYSKRKGFDYLADLLDTFYNKTYDVWQGQVNHFRLKADAENTFKLLKQRPGMFARSLFATMLWFGKEETLIHFRQIMHHIPARLIFTLNMYAENYFDINSSRSVKTLGGIQKRIPANRMLALYSTEELDSMKSEIEALGLEAITNQLLVENENKTIYIDPALKNIPISIGDRSDSIQDLPVAAMGTRFPIEGDTVRLFLQWGKDLPAQHLDMDLSCQVAYENNINHCSYNQLVIDGCKHSGDIRQIPHNVGTAEYIDVNMAKLKKLGAKYVSFTCNAYSTGSLAPNLVVGWMNSKFPMKISSKGVAYDPTAVQHQIRISQNMTKGLIFGVLDVEKSEMIWLEMSFSGQIVQNLDTKGVEALLAKLDAKLKIGDLLELKAEVQELQIVDDPALADEVYDMDWATNVAEVSQLFLG